MNNQLLFQDQGVWKGKKEICKLYSLSEYKDLRQIDQVQSVCFLDKEHIVFYQNVGGFLGNPGGSVEFGENIHDTLSRELVEEAQLELIKFVTIGYENVTYPDKDEPDKCFLRVASSVKLINMPVSDPAGKAIGRVVVPLNKAIETLNWGEKGRILIELATKKLPELFRNNV